MFSLRIGPKVIKRMHCTKTEKISVKLPYSAYSWPIANFKVIFLIYFKIVHRVYMKTASLIYCMGYCSSSDCRKIMFF